MKKYIYSLYVLSLMTATFSFAGDDSGDSLTPGSDVCDVRFPPRECTADITAVAGSTFEITLSKGLYVPVSASLLPDTHGYWDPIHIQIAGDETKGYKLIVSNLPKGPSYMSLALVWKFLDGQNSKNFPYGGNCDDNRLDIVVGLGNVTHGKVEITSGGVRIDACDSPGTIELYGI